MRLSAAEKAALDAALKGVRGKIFLFGSRTDDRARGGDIDILVLSGENAYRL
jgi:predicted nucleotidyltransferase